MTIKRRPTDFKDVDALCYDATALVRAVASVYCDVTNNWASPTSVPSISLMPPHNLMAYCRRHSKRRSSISLLILLTWSFPVSFARFWGTHQRTRTTSYPHGRIGCENLFQGFWRGGCQFLVQNRLWGVERVSVSSFKCSQIGSCLRQRERAQRWRVLNEVDSSSFPNTDR